jgi:hypothetical protein
MEFHRLVAILLILFFAAFLTSTITLTLIQTRLRKQFGWRVFRERSMIDIYWTSLSQKERALLWPGIILFFIILLVGTISKLIDSLG